MTIDEAEIALQNNRRVKFGALWKKAVEYFSEGDLYRNSKNNNNQSTSKLKLDIKLN